ncbi:MAG: alpha/beta hydrolase [Gemmatales bacterium]|nr:alpha/beta hydrolase [Gemmatales bacterium]MCS7159290.1 alpha/beta hydrolase [Gemmatales bacterium]MDW8174490.1 alpha/beta hydrolase [Gemmatales bacterium]MDW8224072.1 alpha/beta hydrolase [Gemmatales bacterium]
MTTPNPCASEAHPVSSRSSWSSLLRRTLVYFALLYLAMLGILMVLEHRLIFRPTPADEEWQERTRFHKQDVWWTLESGEQIHAWWCPIQEPKWYLLYCHGNAGNLSFRDVFIDDWQKRVAAAVLIFDYPGYGHSSGRPSEKNCYAAGRAAYRWLREQGFPAERIVLFGESLGGGVATELALQEPHAALVLLACFTSIPDLAQEIFPFIPARWLVRTRFDNLARIRHYSQPLLILHGQRDELIPPHHAQRLYEACPSRHKKLILVPGHDHNSVGFAAIYDAIREFLDSL